MKASNGTSESNNKSSSEEEEEEEDDDDEPPPLPPPRLDSLKRDLNGPPLDRPLPTIPVSTSLTDFPCEDSDSIEEVRSWPKNSSLTYSILFSSAVESQSSEWSSASCACRRRAEQRRRTWRWNDFIFNWESGVGKCRIIIEFDVSVSLWTRRKCNGIFLFTWYFYLQDFWDETETTCGEEGKDGGDGAGYEETPADERAMDAAEEVSVQTSSNWVARRWRRDFALFFLQRVESFGDSFIFYDLLWGFLCGRSDRYSLKILCCL